MCRTYAFLLVALLIKGLLFPNPILAEDGAELPPRQPSPLSVRQIHSGHSLSDTYLSHPWPGRLTLATAIRSSTRAYDTISKSTIPGSPLHWRWSHKAGYGQPDARHDIGDYELLVTTEAVPLQSEPKAFQPTLDLIERWVKHSWAQGNRGKGAEVMLYSTWVGLENPADSNTGGKDYSAFRQRLETQGQQWEQMQDHANAIRPSGMPAVYMIPGHRLMMRIYDDIQSGVAPGLNSIDDIFLDDIHLNHTGSYAVTCLVYAVIYHRNPQELPNRLAIPEDTLSRAQALYFKAIAWEVAQDYPRAGVS